MLELDERDEKRPGGRASAASSSVTRRRRLSRGLLGGLGGGGSEQNVVVHGVVQGLLSDRDDDVTSAEIVLDDFVGDELVIGDVGEAVVSPAFALDDVGVVADQHGRKFYPPETISDDPSAAEASEQAVS
jgi:hypothetical protein